MNSTSTFTTVGTAREPSGNEIRAVVIVDSLDEFPEPKIVGVRIGSKLALHRSAAVGRAAR